MGCQNHGAGSETYTIVGIGGDVIQKLVEGIACGLCSCGLLCTYGAEGHKEFVVDCTCIVQERANNTLDAFDVGGA